MNKANKNEAQGFDRGDVVYATEMLGACGTATLVSQSGEECEVFCD